MALSIQQDSKYVGKGRWEWAVWLEGASDELDAVDHVFYILHPTFHNPVREIHDRSTKFRLDTSGWGTFTIHATVATPAGFSSLVFNVGGQDYTATATGSEYTATVTLPSGPYAIVATVKDKIFQSAKDTVNIIVK